MGRAPLGRSENSVSAASSVLSVDNPREHNRLIQVGHSFLDSPPSDPDGWDAAHSLVETLCDAIDWDHFPLRCVLLLSTADWCRLPSSISKTVRSELKKKIGYDVPLVGGSMARLYSSAHPGVFMEHGLVLISLGSDNLRVNVDSLLAPYSKSDSDRQAELSELSRRMRGTADMRLGTSTQKYLLGFFPGIFQNPEGERIYRDCELHQEIFAAFDRRYPLMGAAAADDLVPKMGYQFVNDDCLTSGLALALIETDLSVEGIISHGFKACDEAPVTVSALESDAPAGYVVEQINDEPASEFIERMSHTCEVKYGRLLLGLRHGEDFDVVWAMPPQGGDQGRMRLNRPVRRGDQLYVLDTTPEEMITSTKRSLNVAMKRGGVDLGGVCLILAFPCTDRFRHYLTKGYPWERLAKQFHNEWLGVQVVAGLCGGEFGIDEWCEPRANGMSTSLIYFANAHNLYAGSRELQRRLAQYECRLATCKTPRDVMSVAMEGVLRAKAVGGQICMVDRKLGRIVNQGMGHAVQISREIQDWEAVGALTDRPAPMSLIPVPANLRDFAMSLVSDDMPVFLDPPISSEVDSEQDILTLVARCLHAIYVVDSGDRRFHCDPVAIEKGRIVKQLVIPLVGSGGMAIATLQIGIADDQDLDRESFALWIGYAQQIASALERTQEAEERKIAEEVFDWAEQIIHEARLPEGQLTSTYWCERYLAKVVGLLGADGAHMRVFHKAIRGEEYQLAAAVGHMADLLRMTREITTAENGSCNRMLLESGGCVTNTNDETARLNHKVKAVARTEYEEEFARSLSMIEATALLPLVDRGDVFGSFVVDSKRRYFFTERWERIARVAARLAGAILRAKRAEFHSRRVNAEREQMLETLRAVRSGHASASDELRRLVKRLCEIVHADVGSVYIWHEPLQKLVLHTGCNWYVNKEGEACYSKGQGWTGQLAWSEDDVCIVRPEATRNSVCTKRHYEFMVPPAHRVANNEGDARIGIRLKTGRLLGAVTFSYYKEHVDRLIAEDSRILDFLKSLVRVIALHVEAVVQEASLQLAGRLDHTERELFRLLIDASVNGEWNSVLECMRSGFDVDHVVLVSPCEDSSFEHAGLASAQGISYEPSQHIGPMEFFLPVPHEVGSLIISDSRDARLRQWPYKGNTRTLCAVPVLCTQGILKGILAFINRKATPDHPFEFFDAAELARAKAAARTLGAAVDHFEHESRATKELKTQLETATRIGATSLSSAVVMHRLSTPFARIRMHVEWFRRHPECDKSQRASHLEGIDTSVVEAITAINEASTQGVVEITPQKISTILTTALGATRGLISERRVTKNMHAIAGTLVRVNMFAVVGAFVNLLTNAVDAMGRSGMLSLSAKIDADNTHVLVCIENPGPQLTEHDIHAFLNVGFTTKDEGNHLGLGLPLAKQAIDSNGGTMRMMPRKEGGALVEVSFPIFREDNLMGRRMTGERQ